ncbi:MAG: bifunctional folylpolyglutamate synthase/dihydrofolate synthase, partial [Clostridia bacterium]|nr:bifunctional folylpolyglutamate synthase/dihydrofolate synthase [Clostridia bacterium]
MNYVDALEYIHSLGMFSHEASLDRITALCEKLHNPQNKFKSIHIAGTNGKGSVATYLAEIFKRAGYKTGLYTSPY